MRAIPTAALIAALCCNVHVSASDDGIEFRSKEAQSSELRYVYALRRAQKEYYESLAKAKREYVDDLGAALDAALKRKDLDEANRIQATIDVLTEKRVVHHAVVPANRNWKNPVGVVQVRKGDRITVKPITGKWQGGGSKRGVFVDWKGYKGQKWMVLYAQVGTLRFPIRQDEVAIEPEQSGTLTLWCYDDAPIGNAGAVLVEVEIVTD